MRNLAFVSMDAQGISMLLYMIDNLRVYPLNSVIFFDNGQEFECVYQFLSRIKTILASYKIDVQVLNPKKQFEFSFANKLVKQRKDRALKHGYGWCGGKFRWSAAEKLAIIRRYAKGNVVYLALTTEDRDKIKKYKKGTYKFPLIELGMNLTDCITQCEQFGFIWVEEGVNLYDTFGKIKCRCCNDYNQKQLRIIYDNMPKCWGHLYNLQSKVEYPIKGKHTVTSLEKKFENQKKKKKLF